MNAYITDVAAFLPNEPVDNEQMEELLGMVGKVPSHLREKILEKNQIKQRYYAIDPKTRRITHNNAQLAAEAIRKLNPYEGFTLQDIECLCCGTSTPDQIMPGHGSMVHGELKNRALEAVSLGGVCTSGAVALKYAAMNVAAGLSRNAVASGSEYCSTFMRAGVLNSIISQKKLEQAMEDPSLTFESDFLRWMLSDGAGAVFVTNEPSLSKTSMQIEWIENISFAHELDTCMYTGAQKQADGYVKGWREYDSLEEAIADEVFTIKQDVKLLGEQIGRTSIDLTLLPLLEKYGLSPSDITWFLPHYSSGYFKMPMYQRMKEIGFHIPLDRWFSNMTTKGNSGAASFYVILDELYHSGKLKSGDRLLCFVPESGRFSICYVMLRVV